MNLQEKWDTPQVRKLRESIIGKCKAESLDIYKSDWIEIEKALFKTVGSRLCIRTAKMIRQKK